MSDPQDRAEALDDDVHDTEYPPDRPAGVTDPGADDRMRDSIEERAAREEPERGRARGAERPVVQPYVDEDEALLDDEDQLVADAEIDSRDPEADGMPAAAEEAALHLED